MRFRLPCVLLASAVSMSAPASAAFAQGWTDRLDSDGPRPSSPPAAASSPEPRRATVPRAAIGACAVVPGAAAPSVRFSTRLGEVVHHNTRNRTDLRALQSKSGKRAGGVGPGWQPIGLTLTEIRLRTRINVSAQPLASGGVCARLASIEAEMGMEKIDVHVASSYRPGSCQYHAVLDHEMRHVSVFRDAVTRHAPLVRTRLDAVTRTLEPVVANTAKEAATRLRAKIEHELDTSFKEMNRDIERRNQTLDTRESYEREQKRCPKW